MSSLVNARVRVVPNFLMCLRAARNFIEEQDVVSAAVQFEKLRDEVLKMRALLSFAPTSGQPARFLDARSAWGRFQAEQARQMARALGRHEVRELGLARCVVLYAHSDGEVILLAIRHERQLEYKLPKASPRRVLRKT